ncbi:MAG TPA: RES family NAD+ phosphorylase [Candidatus Angelobacter sp.]|nr:RES family NAD+ phosphorylase [Candidatus Angelobacter sp.]
MILWRISNYADLSGDGGLKTSARWHTRGHRIVYLSSSPSSALLEILVHLEIEEDYLPCLYKLLEIQVPDDISFEKLEDWATLPKNWKKKQSTTQAIGDQWLNRNSSALLEVPSALVPHTRNFLLNPQHKDAARITIVSVSRHPLDRRLLQ